MLGIFKHGLVIAVQHEVRRSPVEENAAHVVLAFGKTRGLGGLAVVDGEALRRVNMLLMMPTRTPFSAARRRSCDMSSSGTLP